MQQLATRAAQVRATCRCLTCNGSLWSWQKASKRDHHAVASRIAPIIASIHSTNSCPQQLRRPAQHYSDGLLFERLLRRRWCEQRDCDRKQSADVVSQRRNFSICTQRDWTNTTLGVLDDRYHKDPASSEQIPTEPSTHESRERGRASSEENTDDSEQAAPLKGRGLHRAMQIQELLTKQMALELILSYVTKDRLEKVSVQILDDVISDLRTVRNLLTTMSYKRRLDSFGVNPALEEAADSPETRASRDKLDLELISVTDDYLHPSSTPSTPTPPYPDLGKFIESATERILSSDLPPTHRSLAVLLDAFRETDFLGYGEIVLGAMRRSPLPWAHQTLYSILAHFEAAGDGMGFLRFVSFLCGAGASDHGLKRWQWTRVPGQSTVPCPPGHRNSPGLTSRLIQTSVATGQTDYAKAYLQMHLFDGYGISPKLFWSLMLQFASRRDWLAGRGLLEQICEGQLPVTPELTTTEGLQRVVMATLQLLYECKNKSTCNLILEAAATHPVRIPPFVPAPHMTLKDNWTSVLVDWHYIYDQSPTVSPSASSASSSDEEEPVWSGEDAQAHVLFKRISKILGFRDDTPGFVYHNTETVRVEGDKVVRKLIPSHTLWSWDGIREQVGRWRESAAETGMVQKGQGKGSSRGT